MTSAAEKAAGQVAGHAAEKEKTAEKVEKRRALGRGLESLLPGPRVVTGTRVPAPIGPSDSAAGKQQVPHGPTPVRNDIVESEARADSGRAAELRWAGQTVAAVPTSLEADSEPFDGVIRAVVEEVEQIPGGSGGSGEQQVPHRAFGPVRNDIDESGAGAELRSGWPDQRSGPTQSSSTQFGSTRSSSPHSSSPHSGATQLSPPQSDATSPVEGGRTGVSAPQEGITIFAQAESRVPGNLVVNLALEDIDKNPFQTRYVHNDDALQELAESIKVNGVVQPILVRPAEEPGRYILILGERRLHATRLAGRDVIPAIVRRVSEQQAAEMTIIENLQREDLSPLEHAEAFRVLSEEFKLTQAQSGERVGLSRESVANYMRLLRLPREVMQLLAEKRLTFAKAKELLKLENNDKIAEAALYAVKKGLSFEQIERMV